MHTYFNNVMTLLSHDLLFHSSNNKQPMVTPTQTPQEYLDQELSARGYSVQRYRVIHSAYSNLPTPLQLASYGDDKGAYLHKVDCQQLREILTSGISANGCNELGVSHLHRACKSAGKVDRVRAYLDCGATVQASDGAGRTLLHYACSSVKPAFKTFELIVQRDARLVHMMDAGSTIPLEQVKAEHYGTWNMFLKSILDKYWPVRDTTLCLAQGPPPLALAAACSRPVFDPPHALSLELAILVSNGRMDPDEAIMAQELIDGFDEESTTCGSSVLTDYDDGDDDFLSDYDMDESVMEELSMLQNWIYRK